MPNKASGQRGQQVRYNAAEQSPCYVDEQTDVPITIAGLPYKDLILLLTAINESVVQSSMQQVKNDPPPSAFLPVNPIEVNPMQMIQQDSALMLCDLQKQVAHVPVPFQAPQSKQAHISWSYVAKRSTLPEAVCKTVWAFLQESIGPQIDIESEEVVKRLTGRPHYVASHHGSKNTLEPYKASLRASGRVKLNIPTTIHSPAQYPKPAPPDTSQKKRFSEPEDRLLIMALLFHDGNYELIQSKYFPQYPLNYVKSRYIATLKKHAMAKAGLSRASDLKSIIADMPGSKIKAELLYLFSWLESTYITEDMLTNTAKKIGCI